MEYSQKKTGDDQEIKENMEPLKIEPIVGDVPDNVTVLWSSKCEELGSFEIIHNESEVTKSGSPSEDPSIGDNHIDQSSVFKAEGDIENEGEGESAILNTDDVTEGHMLHVPVPENDGTILADQPATIQVTTSLSSELLANTESNVIQLLLPNDETGGAGNQLQPLNINLGGTSLVTNSVVSPATQTVQAITLSDGTTAFIQHPINIVTSVPNSSSEQVKAEHVDTNTKLEDTCTTISSINQAVKDGLQAIILEDGTTAYLATQQTPQLMENSTLEATTLTFDQLTAPNLQVIPNSMMNLDVKTLAIQPQNGVTNGTVEEQNDVKTVAPTPVLTNPVPEKPQFVEKPFVEKAYKCSYDGCGRYYTTLHHLRVHERSHTGDRPFRCEFNGCGKAFATGYGLKSHTRVHTGEKPYKCPEETCEKAFKTSGDLMKHVRTHTGERPFRCPFEGCTRSFTTSNIRKVHIRTHTGERPYICPEEGCGRAFASATNYKNHIRIHTGEKPYVCTVQGCGKRFTEYSSLYKHHVVHTHAKPYTCSRCGKTYRQTSTLAMHKRTAHGEDVTAESEALLYQVQSQGLEPPEKRARLGIPLNQDDLQDEGEGTLIINTSDTGQQLTLIGSNIPNVGTSDTVQTLPSPNATLEQMGVATFTLGDQGQQVYVITDPAQLEALQQIAQHQFDTDTLDTSLITALPSVDTSSLDPTESGVTTVTEITSTQDIIDNSVSINTTTTVPDI